MLTVPALPKATQCYEGGKKEETEKKLKNRVTPHHQAGSEYLTASPCPTNACSSQSQAPQQKRSPVQELSLKSYVVLLEA